MAYPSVIVPYYSTETFINISTTANTNTYVNSNTILTWWSYYVTSTYPAFLGGACWGGGGCFYIISNTVTYQASTESTITSISTNQITITNELLHTNELINTYYQNIPLYASLGINDTEFVLVAILIILAGSLVVFFSFKGFTRPQQTKLSKFIPAKSLCIKCRTELPPKSIFCNKCGTKQP